MHTNYTPHRLRTEGPVQSLFIYHFPDFFHWCSEQVIYIPQFDFHWLGCIYSHVSPHLPLLARQFRQALARVKVGKKPNFTCDLE